jgi:5S rRNA maturation endonuclease (ribonuclease M5)
VRPVEKILDRLEDVRELNGSWKALCPAHDDTEPSLSISEGDDGRALLKCFAGCALPEIVSALGLEMKDLFERQNGARKKFASTPPETTATVQPCNLKNYARAKALPVEFLKKLGLTDKKYQGRETVRIPYRTESGEEGAVRFRVGLEKSGDGDDRFRWRTGSKAMLYGLWRLKKIRKAGWVVLVEGESDTQTLWYHGFPTLGIPGVETWKEAWVEHLEDVERIYVVIEPDQGGATLKDKLVSSSIRDRLHVLELREYKDASALHVADPEHFNERFADALKNAVPWAELERLEAEDTARKAWAECEDLALAPNILDRFA